MEINGIGWKRIEEMETNQSFWVLGTEINVDENDLHPLGLVVMPVRKYSKYKTTKVYKLKSNIGEI